MSFISSSSISFKFSSINFSTDLDYYFPPQANDDLTALMQSLHIDYKDYRYNGYPHWFPEFNGSEPAFKILFDDLLNRKRNPFPNKLIFLNHSLTRSLMRNSMKNKASASAKNH